MLQSILANGTGRGSDRDRHRLASIPATCSSTSRAGHHPGEGQGAAIDGATAGRASAHHLPLVSGFIVINTILGFKNYLNAYDIIVGLTDGGPGVATRSVAMAIFRGFEGGDYAYQMANAMVFFLISIALALLQLRVTRGRTAF